MKTTSIHAALERVTFLPDRTPSLEDTGNAFTKMADYRNGGIWVGHYAGNTEWERHPHDEFLQALEGETTLYLLIDNEDVPHLLKAGEVCVVPANVWHRFETPRGLKILTITPQPSDHQLERPEGESNPS